MKMITKIFLTILACTGILSAQTTTNFLGIAGSGTGNNLAPGTGTNNWTNGVPTLTNIGTINVDGTLNGNPTDWVVNHTGGEITLTGNRNIVGASVWTMSGGSIVQNDNTRNLEVRDSSAFTMTDGTIDLFRLRTPQTGSITQSGGSVTLSDQFVGGSPGSSYNLSGGTLQLASINANSTEFNLSGGSISLTAFETSANNNRIRFWTVSGDVAMSFDAASAIAVDRFNFANNWLPTATGASLTVADWGQTEFEALFAGGRFQYDGENLNATQFGETFLVNGSTLTVIPEPGTLALLGIAGLALAISQRRRRK